MVHIQKKNFFKQIFLVPKVVRSEARGGKIH